jgi:hypothetical protein
MDLSILMRLEQITGVCNLEGIQRLGNEKCLRRLVSDQYLEIRLTVGLQNWRTCKGKGDADCWVGFFGSAAANSSCPTGHDFTFRIRLRGESPPRALC